MIYFILQTTEKISNLQFCSKYITHDLRQVTTNINTELYTSTSTSDILPPAADLWRKYSAIKGATKIVAHVFLPQHVLMIFPEPLGSQGLEQLVNELHI